MAQALRVTASAQTLPRSRPRLGFGTVLARAVRRWAQQGQLGAAQETESSRYTGGRV
jgi:hypothetical protein